LFTGIRRKKKERLIEKNNVVLMALFVIFFPWMHCRQGKKVFFPFFAASLSLPHLSKNPNTTYSSFGLP
jgi:hypothetical protein